MWVLCFSLLFGVTYSWPPNADCVLRDGSIGRCMPSSQCAPVYLNQKPIHCRYSRSYDLRICCGSRNNYPLTNKQDELYSDDEPLTFPTDSEPAYSQYHPFDRPTQSYKPIFIGNSDYDAQSKPNYYEKHPYIREHSRPIYENSRPSYENSRPSYENSRPSYENSRPSYENSRPSYESSRPSYENSRPSYENSRPNYEFQNAATSGFNYEERPNIYRPVTTSWDFPREEYTPSRIPTWSVGDDKGGTGYETNKRISQQKCEEYSRPVTETIDVLPLSLGAESTLLKVEKCAFSAVKLIVGGEASLAGEFPHMAALGFRAAGTPKVLWNCGGTLISEYYVLTAAHCVNTSNGNPVVVRLGEINLERNDDGAEPEDYGVQGVLIHPKYVKSRKYNDIALVRLSQPVRFNKWIRPACLPYSNDEDFTQSAIATGWGRSEIAGKLSDILMKVNLNIVNNRQCNTFYSTDNPGSSSFSSGIVDTMICAGDLRGGKDTCLGDSGGPLTMTKKSNPCIHHVIGITSFGKICGAPNSPGVYTKVSKFLSWVERNVWSQ